LNILFLEQHPRFVGGSERIGLSLCTQLRRLGHRTHLLYETEGDMVPAFAAVTDTCLQGAIRPLAVRHPAAALASLRLLRRSVRRQGVDIVFTSQVGFVSLLAVARGLLRIPSVVHLGLGLSFPSPLFGWAMPRIAATVTPSEPMRRTCVAVGWPDSRLHVVPNGVDLDTFRPAADRASLRSGLGLPAGAPLVVYVGRLVEEKGIYTLVRAAALLRDRNFAFHLAIIGAAPGSERETLARMAAELNLGADRLSIHGSTDRPQAFFEAADAAAVPSEWPEPFGLAVIEAMACGCVPVVSDAGILPEIIGEENSRCVFRQGDAGQLADRLEFVLSDAPRRGALAEACIARVGKHYSLAQCALSYERIMKDCLPTR
jgi:glycosyltransferase involved in cell wall biosynthesis